MIKNIALRLRSCSSLFWWMIKGYWKIFDSENPDHWLKYSTVLWCVFWFSILLKRWLFGGLPSDLNSWGDFYAGVFAPLAFIWLVRGYYQQGHELKQSTQALLRQEEALSQQVELLAKEEERKRFEETKKYAPSVALVQYRFFESHLEPDALYLTMKNKGANVRNINVYSASSYQERNCLLVSHQESVWSNNQDIKIRIDCTEEHPKFTHSTFCLHMFYLDETGRLEYFDVTFYYNASLKEITKLEEVNSWSSLESRFGLKK